jgi:hypothetical protein
LSIDRILIPPRRFSVPESVFEKGHGHRLTRVAAAAIMIQAKLRSTTQRRRMTTKPFIQGI